MPKYGRYNNRAYSLRLPDHIHKKIKMIAQENGRKVSQEIEEALHTRIQKYESEHGEIQTED